MGYQVRQLYTVSQIQTYTKQSVTEHYIQKSAKTEDYFNFHFYTYSKQLRSITMFEISGLKVNR